MAIESNDSSANGIPTLNPRIHFLTLALPLRAELERAALRYTHNFHDAEDLVSETYISAWVGFASFTAGDELPSLDTPDHGQHVDQRVSPSQVPTQRGSDRRAH